MTRSGGAPRAASSSGFLCEETLDTKIPAKFSALSIVCQLENRRQPGTLSADMPLIKLSRINKGGEIVVNSEHILFIEVEARTTTIHMTHNLLFSVEEPINTIVEKIDALETAHFRPPPGAASGTLA
jgi:uncharacterized protein YlzI (FlbEa/FlbD family)